VLSQNLDKNKRAEARIPDGAVPDSMVNFQGGCHKKADAWRCGLARFNVLSQNLDKVKRAEALVPDGAVPDPMINPKAGVAK